MCTGNADSTAIATIINNFFNSGTAMAMKITITGTMGVAFTNNAAMYINATNSRGAVCYLDFSNCHIPDITTASRYFLYINSATVRLNISGLVVRSTLYTVYSTNTNNNSFNNCTINSSSSHGVYLIGSGNNSFNNCTIKGAANGVYINANGSNYNSIAVFANCTIIGSTNGIYALGSGNLTFIKLIGCLIKGESTQDIYHEGNASALKWFIMGNSFSRASIIVDGTAAIAYKTNAYIYMPQYANQFSQTIS